ncbi:MAG: hypothetical protein AB4368_22100 [Xenococcaceae cyanobacterium]
MVIQQVFNNTVNPDASNLSDRFTDAIAFFISAPLLTDEIEIDVFLQIYLDNSSIRNIPLGRIEEQVMWINSIDTEIIQAINYEFVDTNLEMALLFLPSEAFTLEAFIVKKNITLNSLKKQLDDIAKAISSPIETTPSTDEILQGYNF